MSSATYTPLLPANQTPLEGALVHALDTIERTRTEAAVDVVQTLQRPAQIPAPLLPWLAWDRDVPIWPRWMDEVTRRALLRDSWSLHRRAGTVGGLRALARYAGGELTRVDSPRTRTYCGASMTLAEREDFLSRYPQLRMYRYRSAGQRRGAMFHRLYCGSGSGSRAADLPLDNGARQRFGERAWLYEPRTDTEQALVTWTETLATQTLTRTLVRRVGVPSVAGRVSFLGGALPGYAVASDAPRRIYSLEVLDSYVEPSRQVHAHVINPGLAPLSPTWRTLALPGVRRGLYCGGGYLGAVSVPSSAADRLGRYQALFDPERSLTRRQALLFVGPQRLRFPAFTAELTCRLPGRRPTQSVSRFVRGYWVATPKDRLHTLKQALQAGIAARDQTLLGTRASVPLVARQTLFAGPVLAGSFT
ncbi:MAG: phage tail protein I [Sphingobacteriia bacterium]|nr:phage tail protein I [Sphingobacteriia bacterium]